MLKLPWQLDSLKFDWSAETFFFKTESYSGLEMVWASREVKDKFMVEIMEIGLVGNWCDLADNGALI